MALPITGPITAEHINDESGFALGATTSLDDAVVRTLFTRAPGSEISYEHGRGKFTSIYILYVPPGGGAYGLNLRQMALDAGWNRHSYIEVTINSSTVILSNNPSIPSLTIDGVFPNGAKLINNGVIIGSGGTGGGGDGGTGGTGGTGVNISTSIIIENNGTIGGGGGGGGGGGSGLSATGGGGGGGGGYGVGGSGGYGGGSGTLYGGGGGGAGHGGSGKYSSSGPGGGGGSVGTAGSAGGAGQRGQGAGGGGAAGAATNGNSYVTWTAAGTTYGAVN